MRTCEVAVVGLGLAGAAAMHALHRRGVDVVGFDPVRVGEPRGSSHGSSRVFRRLNAENPAYTALADRALAGWRTLEAESGQTLLIDCPVLEAGPSGSSWIEGSRAAARAAGAPSAMEGAAAVNAAFPAFALPHAWDALVQESGAILLAEAALAALRAPFADRIVPGRAQIEPLAEGVQVAAGETSVLARQVIVAAGPWMVTLVPELAPLLRVTRQAVGWFAPRQPELAALGRFPIFLIEAPQGLIYGFPDFEGRGVKAASHAHGPIVAPDAWDPPPSDAELAVTAEALATFIPGALGPISARDVCLYTTTAPADLRPDAGEEFIIDRLPNDPRIIVASACSGHGAKFAPAIGEILAELALNPVAEADPAYRLDRYSLFASA